MNLKKKEWNQSYKNKDNFIFYPHEEVIRFISKYIKKRIGLNKYINQEEFLSIPKVLDFGCGIGRHIKVIDEFNLDAYGFDLSEEAIQIAKKLLVEQKLSHIIKNIIVSDITKLPYENNSFDYMLSHGVLDSMPFSIAKKGLFELCRCIKKEGLIYMDLISTEDSSYSNNFEEEVTGRHETGTVQTYYDIKRINNLIDNKFTILELNLCKKNDILKKSTSARYHLVIKKI
ncbi:MAG: methyltransferase type 11 [Arcobacter sp.]|nr:MAG: methyltransferase type 11 [Arcobacter sp.]